MNSPEYLIVHCSAGPDRVVRDWDAIRRFHLSKGWRDIGYHFGIELVGDRYEIFKGRAISDTGAQCIGSLPGTPYPNRMNSHSLGICLVGGDPMEGFGPKYPLPPAQKDKLIELLADLCKDLKLPVDRIRLHREFDPKPCPGYGITKEDLQACVAAKLQEASPSEPIGPSKEDTDPSKVLVHIANQLLEVANSLRKG